MALDVRPKHALQSKGLFNTEVTLIYKTSAAPAMMDLCVPAAWDLSRKSPAQFCARWCSPFEMPIVQARKHSSNCNDNPHIPTDRASLH